VEAAVEEYRELGLNLRHYSNMQYVNLTLALAVQAAILSTVLRNPPLSETTRVFMSISGVLMAALFYINEHRIRSYWAAYFHRARELDEMLEYFQYVRAPGRSMISSGVAIRTLFALVFLFWAVSIFVPSILR
jgi:hypothetical protein